MGAAQQYQSRNSVKTVENDKNDQSGVEIELSEVKVKSSDGERVAYVDEATGAEYLYNHRTGSTRWTDEELLLMEQMNREVEDKDVCVIECDNPMPKNM